MSEENGNERVGIAYLIGVVGALLIIGVFALVVYKYLHPEPLGANRAEERARALAEVQAADSDALEKVGWVDPAKGLVRLPIDAAIKIVEREWQNPATARSNLIARVEKANPPPPPPPASPLE